MARTTTTDTISRSGSSTSPIIIRGYAAAIGDGYQGRTSNNASLVTTNLPSITYTSGRLPISGSWIILESLSISGAGNIATVTVSVDGAITRCVVANSSTGVSANAIGASARCVIFDNDLSLTGGSGGMATVNLANASTVRICGNRITGGPAPGITATTSASAIVDNVIYSSGGAGIVYTNTGGAATVYGNTIVSGSSDGIDIVTGSTVLQFAANNMITDNGGYGIDANSAAVAVFAAFNRTRDNTSGAENLATDWLAATKYGHVTTDTGGPETDYTNAGSADYTLISGSPAKGVGHFNYRDMGALQRQETGGSGGGSQRVIGG
jgi:hypothetical protein